MEIQINLFNCRICLRYDVKKCLSIFEIYNERSIMEKINSIANVNIHQGDGLPDKICPDCLLQLETAISFKQTCEASSKLLYNLLAAEQLAVKSQSLSTDEEVMKIDPIKEELIDFNDDSTVDAGSEPIIDDEDSCLREATQPAKKSKCIDLNLICDDCGGTFKTKCKLRVHWKKVHQPEKLICPHCKRAFKSIKPFNLHMKKKTRSCRIASRVQIEGQGKSRIFHCKDCNYKTRRIKDVDTHLTVHTGERRFQCKDCPKTFTQQSSLQSHRESNHKDFRVVTTCHLCGKHIQGRTRFYKHMNTHTQKSVQCKVCNKVLKSRKYLPIHMLRHSGTKSYSCEICAASFFTYYEVCNHRTKVHMKTKNIKCDQCDYKMYTMAVFKAHKARHTGTNVVCLFCGQFSENMEKLAIHQRRHLDRNIQCMQCDKMFHNKRSLSKHMSKDHRCTMLVAKRELVSSKLACTAVKQESPLRENEDFKV